MQLTCHMRWTHSRTERFVAAAGDAPGEAHGQALHDVSSQYLFLADLSCSVSSAHVCTGVSIHQP